MQADGPSPLPELDPAEPAPPLLGGYRLLSEIAGAGRCRIHRARAIGAAHAADVAIKTLAHVRSERAGRARLLQEARIGLNVRGPNLVRVLEVHADPALYLVMEHVEGASLRELLARSPTRDVARYVIPVVVDVLDALFALHNWRNEEGIPGFIVHQAPSLRHMLVGIDGVARLIDLSHARGPLLGGPIDADPTLRHNERAPEQLSAPASVDPRSDLFIVGLALWEALTGTALSDSPEARPHAAGAEVAPLRLSKAGAHPSSACFEAICQRALSPLRHDRFWSAAEMASALRKTACAAGLYADRAELSAWVRDTLNRRAGESATATTMARPRLCVPPPPPAGTRKTVLAGTFDEPASARRRAIAPDPWLDSLEQSLAGTPSEARNTSVEAGRITYHTAVTRLRRTAPHAMALALLTCAVVAGLRCNDTRIASAEATPSPASAPAAAPTAPLGMRPVVTQLLDATVLERPRAGALTHHTERARGTHHHVSHTDSDVDERSPEHERRVDRRDPFIPELPANPY